MLWSMLEHKCKTCGYKGEDKHTDIYECCDYMDPTWMYDWLVRMKKNKKPYVSKFVKWSEGVRFEKN